jgi:hypothetical protein
MKILICGSRSIWRASYVRNCIEKSGFNITEVISGGAHGVDAIAQWWAKRNKIPCQVLKPKWNEYGKPAGVIRNQEMVNLADAVIAIWDGVSPGTKNTISQARSAGKPIEIWQNGVRQDD